jgi:hypothetical protein
MFGVCTSSLVLWDKDEILQLHYPESSATIMAKYYVAFLNKLKHQLVSKHQGNLSKGILSLQYNAASHEVAITH